MSEDTDWTVEEMCARFGIAAPRAPAAPVTRAMTPPTRKSSRQSPRLAPGHPLVESLRLQLADQRRHREALEHELGSLRQELAMVKAEVGVARQVADIAERLERLEASRTALRSVG